MEGRDRATAGRAIFRSTDLPPTKPGEHRWNRVEFWSKGRLYTQAHAAGLAIRLCTRGDGVVMPDLGAGALKPRSVD